MTDERPAEPEADAAQGSVFGNLPGSRPGTRSPRRNSTAKARVSAAAKPKPAKPKPRPKPQSRPRAAAPPPPRTETEASPPPTAEPAGGAGLEDIAWAGVAAAAEAATLGVRLASRAIEALRGNSERG